jgi:hypothetical protein
MIPLAILLKYVNDKTEDFSVDTFITVLEKIQGGEIDELQRDIDS